MCNKYMQHFADFGIVKQINKQKKKFNEIVQGGQQFIPDGKDAYAPRYIPKEPEAAIEAITNLYNKNNNWGVKEMYPQVLEGIKNKREVTALSSSMKGDYEKLIDGYKRINRRAIKATTIDPLTMPYKQTLDWNAPQSFGGILKNGLKTKPVRQSSNEAPLDRAKRFYQDYESIEPDKRGYGAKLGESAIKGAAEGTRKAWKSFGGLGGLLS